MQALVLLNDPQYVEASRLIAARMLTEGGESLADRIEFAFKLATSRKPSSKESSALQEVFTTQLNQFKQNRELAKQILEIGEYRIEDQFPTEQWAAYTMLANAILNLTETIMKA